MLRLLDNQKKRLRVIPEPLEVLTEFAGALEWIHSNEYLNVSRMGDMTKTTAKKQDIVRLARTLELAGDPVRLRILGVIFEERKACVSRIAERLDLSIACVSHHLQLFAENGMLESVREGKNICYSLGKGEIVSDLRRIIRKHITN